MATNHWYVLQCVSQKRNRPKKVTKKRAAHEVFTRAFIANEMSHSHEGIMSHGCVYMYIYVHMYTCKYIYMSVKCRIYMRVSWLICVYICTYMYIYIHICIYIYEFVTCRIHMRVSWLMGAWHDSQVYKENEYEGGGEERCMNCSYEQHVARANNTHTHTHTHATCHAPLTALSDLRCLSLSHVSRTCGWVMSLSDSQRCLSLSQRETSLWVREKYDLAPGSWHVSQRETSQVCEWRMTRQ